MRRHAENLQTAHVRRASALDPSKVVARQRRQLPDVQLPDAANMVNNTNRPSRLVRIE
jgi:hypothetical protein